ncbi:MAG: 2-polyprenyl-3-methyl-6-methoxy-1,4-benzoquinone monooxygenase [Gammaproteobacteria bacterium]
MKNDLSHGRIDQLIISFDNGLQTLFGQPSSTGRKNPDKNVLEQRLNDIDRNKSERLFRVNHAGEVSAQALYQGQALTARDKTVRERMTQSAAEENDHLIWCESRLADLGGHKSYLNAFWYIGSFTTGLVAGLAGDKWSLGFVVETENQVVRHLDEHLEKLPLADQKGRAVLEQMKEDELHHANVALESGAVGLPIPIKKMMTLQSKIMTTLAYWI